MEDESDVDATVIYDVEQYLSEQYDGSGLSVESELDLCSLKQKLSVERFFASKLANTSAALDSDPEMTPQKREAKERSCSPEIETLPESQFCSPDLRVLDENPLDLKLDDHKEKEHVTLRSRTNRKRFEKRVIDVFEELSLDGLEWDDVKTSLFKPKSPDPISPKLQPSKKPKSGNEKNLSIPRIGDHPCEMQFSISQEFLGIQAESRSGSNDLEMTVDLRVERSPDIETKKYNLLSRPLISPPSESNSTQSCFQKNAHDPLLNSKSTALRKPISKIPLSTFMGQRNVASVSKLDAKKKCKKLDKFQHIISPVSQYVQNSSSSPLVHNVKACRLIPILRDYPKENRPVLKQNKGIPFASLPLVNYGKAPEVSKSTLRVQNFPLASNIKL